MWDDYLELRAIVINIDQQGSEDELEKRITNGELEYVIAGIDVPYYDTVLNVRDHWRPDTYHEALKGNFDACEVDFEITGAVRLAYKKEVFKKKWGKFVAEREEKNMEVEFLSEGDDPALDAFLKEEIDKKLKNKNGTKESPKRGD